MGDYYNNKVKKQKWLYGFNLSTMELTTTKTISYTITESPYADNPSEYITNLLPVSKQYFYNTSTNSNYKNDEPPKKRKFGGHSNKQCQYYSIIDYLIIYFTCK